jgi:hypothetical protein
MPRERDSLSSEDRLRERYEELKQLRETQPERDAAHARQALEKHTAASDALVASLRAEIAASKENQQPSAAADETLRKENAELRARLAECEARTAFFQTMTGLDLDLDSAAQVARCSVGAGAGADGVRRAAFEVHLAPVDGDEGDIEYVPTDLSACAEHLPEYLQDSIICARQTLCRTPERMSTVTSPSRLCTHSRGAACCDPAVEKAQAPAFLQKLLSGVAVDA